MVKKKAADPKENRALLPTLGIPVLHLSEKKVFVVPVKLQPTVKKAIPRRQSSWIRELIIRELTREAEGPG